MRIPAQKIDSMPSKRRTSCFLTRKREAEYNLSLNNRIVIDPENEALSLWNSLFNRCGISF